MDAPAPRQPNDDDPLPDEAPTPDSDPEPMDPYATPPEEPGGAATPATPPYTPEQGDAREVDIPLGVLPTGEVRDVTREEAP